ncbi:MAG TPA: hypothetical protein VEZ13_15600 [Brevibacillus sp.]|nr:hypothetical protein [Brevibacillus sp.]
MAGFTVAQKQLTGKILSITMIEAKKRVANVQPFSYICLLLEKPSKGGGGPGKLVEEKGKKAKAFGILTKLERKRRNLVLRPTLIHFFEANAFGRGSAFGVEAARDDLPRRAQPAWSVLPFSSPGTTAGRPLYKQRE